MTTIDTLIATWSRRRDRILKAMRAMDKMAEEGFPDQGGYVLYMLLETELVVVRKVLADLRRAARHAKAGAS